MSKYVAINSDCEEIKSGTLDEILDFISRLTGFLVKELTVIHAPNGIPARVVGDTRNGCHNIDVPLYTAEEWSHLND